MKNRTKIDQLYSEKLKDAQVKPPMDTWSNIAGQLPEQRKKKVLLPFWYKIAGAAAVFLLLFSLFLGYFKETPTTGNNSLTIEVPNEKILPEENFDSFHQQMQGSSRILDSILSRPHSRRISSHSTNSSMAAAIEKGGKPNSEGGEMIPEKTSENQDSEVVAISPPSDSDDFDSEESQLAYSFSEDSSLDEESDKNEIMDLETLTGQETLSDQETAITEHTDEQSDSNGRLSISTKAAPIYFEPGKGSNNSAEGSGETSLAYGINVAYQLSDHLSIRSGINKMDLHYSTSELPGQAARAMGFPNKGDASVLASPAVDDLEQDLKYLEVPLEMEYSLLDKKVQVKLIGGGSLMFANKNELMVNSPMGIRSLGEAENIENLQFTTNVGLGFGYELFQQFNLNIEPIIKFPLNSDNSGVSPYYFGVYSGFSFQF